MIDFAARIVRSARRHPASTAPTETSTVAELVADAFEVDDERVDRETDGDDQTRDAGERQAVAHPPRHDQQHEVGQYRRDDQRGDRHAAARRSVLEDRVAHHQDEADETGDQPAVELGRHRGWPRWSRCCAPRTRSAGRRT